MSITEKDLVWWREVPIDVESGFVHYLSEHWKGKIYIVSCLGFDESRKKCSWNSTEYENVQLIYGNLDSVENEVIINDLLNLSAIHLFSGIKGKQKVYLDKLKSLNPNRKDCVLICESPSAYGRRIKKIIKGFLYHILYGYYHWKYGKMITAFFPMGYKAALKYISYGWERKKIFPFMYLPDIKPADSSATILNSDKIECLYLGRFKNSTKGVDVLIKAIDFLNDSKLHFNFVGGYGDDRDNVIKWCNESQYADYIGSWNQEDVVNMMAKTASIVIVPSRYDGWNMAPYQSIFAGIGCIVSDKAGSEELIEFSQSGIIFKSDKYKELARILRKVSSNPSIIEKWRKNALLYRDKVSANTVGNYFVGSLKYSFGEITIKPECPWENKK